MNEMTEKEIRERLERAVAPIDPVAPALDVLRERAVKLRRFRISMGGGLLAAAAAAVTVAVVVVPANGSSNVHVAAAPSQASLTKYVADHGGKHASAPLVDGSHYVGAYSTKNGIQVVSFGGGAWRADGGEITKYGPAIRLGDASGVIPGHAAFAVRTIGADVSYFGGVLYDADGTWTPAHFAKCPAHKALSCAYAGPEEPYGHVATGSFVSVSNNCLPYCAAGTNYLITWRWNAALKQFGVKSVTKYRVYHVPN
ncbi:MAG TPA: hypothetical protein VHW74_04985 [Mycobacteriales bacterium]|jgi:hypothetical protein|nr:hypothetical protein [Mycobacteriales bacterium]